MVAAAVAALGCGPLTASTESDTLTIPRTVSGPKRHITADDLAAYERSIRRETDAVRAAQQAAAAATDAQARGQAMQAQWDTATIPLGAEASGLSEARYRDVRNSVDQVLTTLDFQGKIDGPLSIDLERADEQTKSRVSGDAFAGLPPDAAMALRARMDRLVPLWSEYKKLVAVAG